MILRPPISFRRPPPPYDLFLYYFLPKYEKWTGILVNLRGGMQTSGFLAVCFCGREHDSTARFLLKPLPAGLRLPTTGRQTSVPVVPRCEHRHPVAKDACGARLKDRSQITELKTPSPNYPRMASRLFLNFTDKIWHIADRPQSTFVNVRSFS